MRKQLIFIVLSSIFLVLAACGTDVEDDYVDEEVDIITATGIYNGQADPHTIEIETDEGPRAFQLTMEARDDVEGLVEGKRVTYMYREDGEQLVIESIKQEASEDNLSDGITATGIYNGQADPHTIEIEIEEGPTAFQLSMEARDDVEALTEGREVTYTYIEEGVQLIINSIHISE